LERFIVKHRRDYVDLHRITERERDNIEHEVSFTLSVVVCFTCHCFPYDDACKKPKMILSNLYA
jgi:hypothetical protein